MLGAYSPGRRPCESGGSSRYALLLTFTAFMGLLAAAYFYYSRAGSEKRFGGKAEIIEITDTGSLPQGLSLPDEPALNDAQGREAEALRSASEAIKEGQAAKAAIILKAALTDNPDSIELRSYLSKTLNKAALERYDSGDYAGAAETLKEALSFAGEPAIAENLALVLVKLEDLEGAAQALEPFAAELKARAALKDIYVRLGNLNYRNGRVKDSVLAFQKALGIDPSDGRIKDALVKLGSEDAVESAMGSSAGEHFLVKFDGEENAATGRVMVMLLEEAYLKVGSDLGYYPEERTEALLYSRESFHDITESAPWSGAIYDGRIKIPAGGVYEKTGMLEKVIFHEYTHAVVHRLSGGKAPAWLHEGLAQHEEGKKSAGYGRFLKELAAKDAISLRRLEGSFMNLGKEDAAVAYLLSLSATEYMIREFGTFSVKKTLEGLARGGSLDEAVSSALFISYEEFERSWTGYLKRQP